MIRLICLDFDGVMTDSRKTYGSDGLAYSKQCNDKDFTAIKRFRALNVPVVFLSGDAANGAIACARRIPFIYADKPKESFLPRMCDQWACEPQHIVFVGDDYPDLALLKAVGYPHCPNDAIGDVRRVSTVLPTGGGEGCIADLFTRIRFLELISSREEDYAAFEKLDKQEKW